MSDLSSKEMMVEVPKRLIERCFGFVNGYFQMDPGSAESNELWRDLNREITRPRASHEQSKLLQRTHDYLFHMKWKQDTDHVEAIALCTALTKAAWSADEPEAQRLRGILRNIGECISGHDGHVFDDVHALLEQSSALAASSQPPGLGLSSAATQAARDVLAERWRQRNAEGWTLDHDDDHSSSQMATAAAWYALKSTTYQWTDVLGPDHPDSVAYAMFTDDFYGWNWDRKWWKPKGQRQDLVRAGALILAEIERLDRASSTATKRARPCAVAGCDGNAAGCNDLCEAHLAAGWSG